MIADNLTMPFETDGRASEEEIRTETLKGYAFMCGAEIGWAFARAERPSLGDALDVDPGPARRALLDSENAAAHCGTNGLDLERFEFSDDSLTVLLARLTPQTVNPCMQAMMWVSELMPVIEVIEVRVPEATTPAIAVHRAAFDVVFPR